jgi:hypothetical protein
LLERSFINAVFEARPIERRTRVMTDAGLNGRNRLLAALTPLALLGPNLKSPRYKKGAVLQRPGEPIERVYFPNSGMFLCSPSWRPAMGETATIEREGVVGVMAGIFCRRATI